MRSEAEVSAAFDRYADIVRRICFMHLKSYSDVEDVFQEVFLKYALYRDTFENLEHEKAWIVRVCINQCKDVLGSFFVRKVTSLEDVNLEPFSVDDGSHEVLDAVLRLPDKYRDVTYLFYYEGYSAVEIAKILGKNENTIYTWLARARSGLKAALGGDELVKPMEA